MKATPKEIEEFKKLQPQCKRILAWKCQGLTLKQISLKMKISINTLNSYIFRSKMKLRFKSTSGMLFYIVRRPELEEILRRAL
jgi:DNA-binding CsgD family transcriptional regulator